MSTQPDEPTSVDVGVSDADLFDGAMAPDTPATPPAEEPPPPPTEAAPTTDERPRDEQGRFVKQDETSPPAPSEASPPPMTPAPPPPADEQQHRIPLAEHLSVRERAQKAEAEAQTERSLRAALEQRLAALEQASKAPPKPEEKPDPLLDPVGFEQYLERKFEERFLSQQRENSLRSAHKAYGQAFSEAYAAAQQAIAQGDRALQARMQSASDPGETLIQWHQEQRVFKEVGNDPAAYRQRLLDESLKDPAFLAKAIEAAKAQVGNPSSNGARPVVQLPPSLSGVARADAHHSNPDDSDVSDEGLFRYATSVGKR